MKGRTSICLASTASATTSSPVRGRTAGGDVHLHHCPYVKAVIDRIVRDCRDLSAQGVGSVAAMSNDPTEYPEDSFENMKRIAREKGLRFPTFSTRRRRWHAPTARFARRRFLGFDAALELHITAAWMAFFEAMVQIANTGIGPKEQIASIGCSIK